MNAARPFLLMVAGPNGSGKTTLTTALRQRGYDFGEYINPDDIALDLTGTDEERTRQAQLIADERRASCLAALRSFSFETVMSHPSKLDVLREGRRRGFRILVYFVATSDPAVNLARVRQRVALGGHSVPADKLIARYRRSIGMLPEAISLADEVSLFDNTRSIRGAGAGLRLVFRRSMRDDGAVTTFVAPGRIPDWLRHALGPNL